MQKRRKVPLRKCVVCQEMKPKRELVRIVKTPEDEVLLDHTGKKSGRGAYLCASADCFEKAKKSRAFDRALKHTVGQDVYERLEQEFLEKAVGRYDTERPSDE